MNSIDAADLMSMRRSDFEKLDSFAELDRWASALGYLACGPRAVLRPMIQQLGRRPYTFERNMGRWPDGYFHLVDRSYQPFAGVAFSYERLRELGVIEWTRSPWQRVAFSGEMYPLIDDAFDYCVTQKAAKRLSELLRRISSGARAEYKRRRGKD